jgi:hypothetical protein
MKVMSIRAIIGEKSSPDLGMGIVLLIRKRSGSVNRHNHLTS